ncbi:MAG: 2-hydroxyacid dehydrogenase [Armatimonadota bacterium]
MLLISIPDDYPSVVADTPAHVRLREVAEVALYTSLPRSTDELLGRINRAHTVVAIRASSKFTAGVLERARPALQHIAIWGTGTDTVDLEAAKRLGITISNTPNTATEAMAEHCLALMLAVARRLVTLDVAVRSGEWPRGMLFQLSGKTLGIIGTGAIGTRFAQLARGMDMKVIAWTMHPDPHKAQVTGFTYIDTLEELLKRSDVVSLHLRLTPQTRGTIGAAQFAFMKDGAIFINSARGDIVDEVALEATLRSGKLLGAGLDVFAVEPIRPDNALLSLPNVVLTPHTGGTTPEALQEGLNLAAENVVAFLQTGSPLHRVV